MKKKRWKILEDFPTKRQIYNWVGESVPVKYTKVKAGTRIIDQGERVTGRHLAMLTAMKKELNEIRKLWEPLPIVSSLIIAAIILIFSALYFKVNQPEIIQSLQKLSLLVSIVIATFIFAKIVEWILLRNNAKLMESLHYPLIIPFATLLTCILLGSRVSLYTSAFLAIILSAALAVEHLRFLVLNIIAAIVVILSTQSLSKRKEIFWVCGKVYLSILPLLFAFSFSANSFWNFTLAHDLVIELVFMMAIAILVVGLLPVLETSFKMMTEMSLMELMDPNSELLRRMTLEIPGTYQHSLLLGSLAESMANAIHADGLFCRAATLYHDIGKLNNPLFFTENQQSGIDIHGLLSPAESAEVIIAHVKDGVELARKYHLPESFIDIIQQHHGTTLAYFFYRKELDLRGGDLKAVEEEKFRYPGPKPHSKESTIIMIADTVEAASRSLENVDEEVLTELVHRMVKEREDDKQFEESDLTFEELGIVKGVLIKTLVLARHIRIKYPERLPTKIYSK